MEQDLDGLGIYSLHASVPSPAINVLCVNMDEEELTPMIKVEDPPKKTKVDSIFGWNLDDASDKQSPPVFPNLPLEYNTVLNHTGQYGRKAIYLLGRGAPGYAYNLCAIKAYQTPNCSTRYNVSSSGAQLEALCEDPANRMRYIESLQNASAVVINKDWVEGATDSSNSLSLNAGEAKGNASNARLLTQLILTNESRALNRALPSPAEALAVMAGNTLLMGTLDTPFVESWNYSATIIDPGDYQMYNASLRAQEYASGGNKGYQRGFHVVLATVFMLNLISLIYLLASKGMITDFSEPVNLFTLAVNSPPSDMMAGSCGSGPQGQQFKVPWYVNAAGDHLYIQTSDETKLDEHEMSTPGTGGFTDEEPLSPMRRAFRRFSRQTSLL